MVDKYKAAAHYQSWYADENERSLNPYNKLHSRRRRRLEEDDDLEPTKAATVQNEEEYDPQRPLSTFSTRTIGDKLGTIELEGRASENQSDVVEKPRPLRRSLPLTWYKTKEHDDEDPRDVEVPLQPGSQGTFWNRYLYLVGLRNHHSIGATMAGIGASVIASTPLGIPIRNVRIDILDFDRDKETKKGSHRSRSWTLNLWRLIVRKSH